MNEREKLVAVSSAGSCKRGSAEVDQFATSKG